MSMTKIHTFSSIAEYRKVVQKAESEDKKIITLNFKNLDELNYDNYFDLTNLIEHYKSYPQDIHSFPDDIDIDNSYFIIKQELANHAINYLYFVFDSHEPLNLLDEEEILDSFIPFKRKNIYSYDNEQFNDVVKWLNDNKIPFINFNHLKNGNSDFFKSLSSNKDKESFIEISSVVSIAKDNSSMIYIFEEFIEAYENCNFIVQKDLVENTLKFFNSIFDSEKSISEIVPVLDDISEEIMENKTVKISDLTDNEFNKLIQSLKTKLFGHKNFKKRFEEKMGEFRILNKINVSNIFSILLLGDSGLGKTEFARIIKENLDEESSFIKINFGNYSSDNSLNSLIGSPRGYVGSEHGELSLKIKKSKAGIILCDEFEKASEPVFNFFLELLEDGKFTDSLGIEHNLDGYIIVFTTNLSEEDFVKILPNELQSRLDLVFNFLSLSDGEKREFAAHQFNFIVKKLREYGNDFDLTNLDDKNYFDELDVNNVNNLREIKRLVFQYIFENIKWKNNVDDSI